MLSKHTNMGKLCPQSIFDYKHKNKMLLIFPMRKSIENAIHCIIFTKYVQIRKSYILVIIIIIIIITIVIVTVIIVVVVVILIRRRRDSPSSPSSVFIIIPAQDPTEGKEPLFNSSSPSLRVSIYMVHYYVVDHDRIRHRLRQRH